MNQLAIRENQQIATSQSEFEVMKEQAKMLLASGFLPTSIKSPEQAIAVILIGREIGIGTMQALNNITVIQGKPTISPQLMLALIGRSGQLEDIRIKQTSSPDGASHRVTVTMKRKGRSEHHETFGTDEARAMQLLGKDNYKKQPLTMMKWRAVAACARVVFPDIILGFYSPEEMGAEVAIGDNEDLTVLPTEEPKPATVVRMPSKDLPTIEAEVVDDKPQTRTEELARQREAAPVSKETKARLLYDAGCVSYTAKGFEVSDKAAGEVFEVTKTDKIRCTCPDWTDLLKWDDEPECAHVVAVNIWRENRKSKAA